MPTQKEIADRIAEMRGRDEIVVTTIIDTVFGDSEEVYMSECDSNNWRDREFVFVIPTNVSSVNSMLARGWWAETQHFELPIVLTI
jgi:hypothetical protein